MTQKEINKINVLAKMMGCSPAKCENCSVFGMGCKTKKEIYVIDEKTNMLTCQPPARLKTWWLE